MTIRKMFDLAPVLTTYTKLFYITFPPSFHCISVFITQVTKMLSKLSL